MSKTVDLLQLETIDDADTRAPDRPSRVPTLTILAHPSAARVGDICQTEPLLRPGRPLEVSRNAPTFSSDPRQPGRAKPLTTPFVSRKPVAIARDAGGGFRIDATAGSTAVRVDGREVTGAVLVSPEHVERGVVIELGKHVVLLLHWQAPPDPGGLQATLGLVGGGDAIHRLRSAIRDVAVTELPVLIRGETGSGKELVARGVHALSGRRGAAFVALNMAAIPATLAASELFGHVRGAFSGATTAHDGYFERADAGTLFLDEVGDTPSEVQATLLRVLETGEVQRVGAKQPRSVDVRLVSATDADLDAAIGRGTFRAPLMYRLASHELHVPPLRDRREDIGRLLVAFLSERLAALGREALLEPAPTERRVWLAARVVARLARYRWPGNVRQLRNVANFLASRAAKEGPLAADDPELDRLLPGALGAEAAPKAEVATWTPSVKPRDVRLDQLYDVLVALDFRLGPAALELGISRPSLNALVDAHPRLKRPSQLSAAEIAAGRRAAEGQGVPLWKAMEVSKRGLQRRVRELERDGAL